MSGNKSENDACLGAAYIRVSTDKQEELSPGAQKRLIMDYAKQRHILLPDDFIFVENGVSGKRADRRPEFQRMIALAKSKPKPFDVILLWKFSRFARNQDESSFYKSLLRNKCKIEVVSVSEPIPEGMFGRLNESIIEWMDEFYSYNLSTEVHRGMMEKALRGGYQARPPLGYRIETKKAPPVIVPEEAALVKRIFHLYVNKKHSFFEIARRLNAEGFKTSHGKNFDTRSIEYILQNPTYIGKIRWNRTLHETNEIKDESEWVIADGSHEPIVDGDSFKAAQERMNRGRRLRGKRPSSTYKHWLSGLVTCGNCGRALVVSGSQARNNGKRYYNFQCYGYSKGTCASSHSISALKLEQAVLSCLKATMFSDARHFQLSKPANDNAEEALLRKQLSGLPLKLARVQEAYRDGVDGLDEYKQNKARILAEQKRIEELLAQKEADATKTEQARTRIGGLCELLQSRCDCHIKNKALQHVIDKMVYNKQENKLEIFFYFH